MKNIICSSLCFLTFALAFPQNLIVNGGFESGTTNWGNWWSRDGKAGATIVSSPVNSGTKALQLNYTGSLDWSFPVNKQYTVNTGDQIELSAWVNAVSVGSSSQLSVELLNANGTVTNWIFGACAFSTTGGQFIQFKKSFIVPLNVSKIVPRLEGYGPNNFAVDDISMVLLGNQFGPDNLYSIENDSLKAVIYYPSLKISVLNKVNNKTYTLNPLYEYSISSVDTSSSNQMVLQTTHLINKTDLTIKFSVSGNSLDINLVGDSSAILENNLNFPGAIASNQDDYLVIPRATGLIWPVNKNYFSSSFAFYDWKSTMSFIGVTNLNSGYMIVSDDPWDTEAMLNRSGVSALISPEIVHHSAKGIWSYDRNLHYVFVNKGYNEMCQWYRKFAETKGYLKTLDEKAVENPNIERLKGAVDFWVINMGMSQNDARNFIQYGLDRAIISLSGYETSLPILIDTLNSKGFLTSEYDIFTDVWPGDIHPEWGYRRTGYPEDVIIKKDGNYQEGWLAFVSGNPFQGYVICSQTHSDYVNSMFPVELAVNHFNGRFIDVEMASGLKECYSEVHPVSRKTDAIARFDALNTVKNKYSLVTGVEEARDFAFPVSDYGEGTMSIFPQVTSGYSWASPIDTIGNYYGQNNLNPVTRVPLHGLVYHDVHIPTWYTGDGVSKVPSFWDDKDLFNILYATMPLFMPPNRAYWNLNLEKFLTSYHLISSINRKVGFEQMTLHSFLSTDKKIQQTFFSNGWEITVNFDNASRAFKNMQLAGKGFYASDGGQQEVFRIFDPNTNSVLAASFADDRLFINPYGVENSYKGVKTSGSVFLQNNSDGVHLAFIGSEKFIYLNPSQMPWKLGHAFSETTGKPIPLTDAGDGWLLLNRPANESFIRFDLDTLALSVKSDLKTRDIFDCYPNPAGENITVTIGLSEPGNVQLSIYNLLGQQIKELINEELYPGLRSYDFNLGDVPNDLYFLVFNSGDDQVVKKLITQ
jgi:hypothetical protein